MVGCAMIPPELMPEEALETPTEEWDWFFGVCGGVGSAVQLTEEVVAANAARCPGPTLGGLKGRWVGKSYGDRIPPQQVPATQGYPPDLDTSVQGPIATPIPFGIAITGAHPTSNCLLGFEMEEVAPQRPVPSFAGDLLGLVEERTASEDGFLALPDLLPSGLVEECMLGEGLAQVACFHLEPDHYWHAWSRMSSCLGFCGGLTNCTLSAAISQAVPWGDSLALESSLTHPELPSLDSVWGSSSTVGKGLTIEEDEDVWSPGARSGVNDPQLPSLRSVFGTCEGSCMGGVKVKEACTGQVAGHGFPSLYSIFGTCGSVEAMDDVPPHGPSPQLPSLRSVFGSCGGVDEELAVPPELPGGSEEMDASFEALGFVEIVLDDTHGNWSGSKTGVEIAPSNRKVCPGVVENVALEREQVVLISKVHDATVGVASCLPQPPFQTIFGTYTVASPVSVSIVAREGGGEGLKRGALKKGLALAKGCTTMLKNQCQDPLFDAQWNVIGMLNSLMADPLAVAVDVLNGTSQQPIQVFYEILEHVIAVPRQHIFEMRRLGEGAYGCVSLSCCPGLGEVAVKWFKSEERSSRRPEFQHECALLAELPRHKNLLKFMGLVKQSSDSNEIVGYISEFCDMGTLSKYARRNGVAPPLKERITMALQIARGMAILHRNNICHFDLKPENILLMHNSSGEHPHVRIGDFGLARRLTEGCIKSPSSLRGTLPYLSPEMVSSMPLVDAKVDVWAFGAVLSEMVTLEVPYRGKASEEILMGLMEGTLKPGVPEWVEPEYKRLVDSCLEYSAIQRPNFEQIVDYLEGLSMGKGWHIH